MGARRIAIVQQQDVAVAQRHRQSLVDGIGIAMDGIETTPRPTREPQLQPRQNRVEKGIAQPRRRAKKKRRDAGEVRAVILARDISALMRIGPSSEKLCRCRWL